MKRLAAVNVRNLFAWVAFRAGDWETAGRQLGLLGEDRDPGVWGGLTALKKAQREMAER